MIPEEEGEEDPSDLIYDIPECFMMMWEELMGITCTTGYDIWSEDNSKIPTYPTSTYEGRHFKPHSDNPTPIYGGRHFKPPTFGNRQPCESPNKAAQETPNEEDRVLKQLQKT